MSKKVRAQTIVPPLLWSGHSRSATLALKALAIEGVNAMRRGSVPDVENKDVESQDVATDEGMDEGVNMGVNESEAGSHEKPPVALSPREQQERAVEAALETLRDSLGVFSGHRKWGAKDTTAFVNSGWMPRTRQMDNQPSSVVALEALLPLGDEQVRSVALKMCWDEKVTRQLPSLYVRGQMEEETEMLFEGAVRSASEPLVSLIVEAHVDVWAPRTKLRYATLLAARGLIAPMKRLMSDEVWTVWGEHCWGGPTEGDPLLGLASSNASLERQAEGVAWFADGLRGRVGGAAHAQRAQELVRFRKSSVETEGLGLMSREALRVAMERGNAGFLAACAMVGVPRFMLHHPIESSRYDMRVSAGGTPPTLADYAFNHRFTYGIDWLAARGAAPFKNNNKNWALHWAKSIEGRQQWIGMWESDAQELLRRSKGGENLAAGDAKDWEGLYQFGSVLAEVHAWRELRELALAGTPNGGAQMQEGMKNWNPEFRARFEAMELQDAMESGTGQDSQHAKRTASKADAQEPPTERPRKRALRM